MNWRKVAAGFTAALLSVTTASIFPTKTVFAADVCVIDTDTEHQMIRGFGGINHPEWAGDLTQAQRQTAFGNGENELGLTVLRVFVNPDSSQWNRADHCTEHDKRRTQEQAQNEVHPVLHLINITCHSCN